jgi:hypothetical protein
MFVCVFSWSSVLLEGPLPYLYMKESVHSEAKCCIQRRDVLAPCKPT